MNYRSAVVLGRPRLVDDEAERARALDLVVDQVVPGRSATLRPHTRKELAATAVLALPLAEASLKVRAGGPVDDEPDVAAGVWGGHVPLRLVAGEPVARRRRRRRPGARRGGRTRGGARCSVGSRA